MTRTSLRDVTCSIARTVDILSDAWAWLIVRDVFVGVRRFDDLCLDLGISRKVLATRLAQLVEADVLVKAPLTRSSAHLEYHLTAKGGDLVPVLATLVAWGDRWEATPSGPPLYLEHSGCDGGGTHVTCTACGKAVNATTLAVRRGPGGSTGRGTAIIGAILQNAADPQGEPA